MKVHYFDEIGVLTWSSDKFAGFFRSFDEIRVYLRSFDENGIAILTVPRSESHMVLAIFWWNSHVFYDFLIKIACYWGSLNKIHSFFAIFLTKFTFFVIFWPYLFFFSNASIYFTKFFFSPYNLLMEFTVFRGIMTKFVDFSPFFDNVFFFQNSRFVHDFFY